MPWGKEDQKLFLDVQSKWYEKTKQTSRSESVAYDHKCLNDLWIICKCIWPDRLTWITLDDLGKLIQIEGLLSNRFLPIFLFLLSLCVKVLSCSSEIFQSEKRLLNWSLFPPLSWMFRISNNWSWLLKFHKIEMSSCLKSQQTRKSKLQHFLA